MQKSLIIHFLVLISSFSIDFEHTPKNKEKPKISLNVEIKFIMVFIKLGGSGVVFLDFCVRTQGESENGDFTAHVLYGCP